LAKAAVATDFAFRGCDLGARLVPARQELPPRQIAPLTLLWPDSASSILEQARPRFLQIADDYGWLNPHLGLSVEWDGDRLIDIATSDPGWRVRSFA
jgi:hypothetical protein